MNIHRCKNKIKWKNKKGISSDVCKIKTCNNCDIHRHHSGNDGPDSEYGYV